MSTLLRKCKGFLRVPFREKCWFFFIWLLSGPIRASLLCLPFRKLSPLLGRYCRNVRLNAVAGEEQKRMAWRIGQMTTRAAAYTPWESKCLVQAMVASMMLRHYGIPYVLHLGVAKGEADAGGPTMKAHAWLAVGPCIITGREGHRTYTIVSTFVSPLLACE